jgi:hypothetical protein
MISKRVLIIAACLLVVSATGAMAAVVNTGDFTVFNLNIGASDLLNLNLGDPGTPSVPLVTSHGVILAPTVAHPTPTTYNQMNTYLAAGFGGGTWSGTGGIQSSPAAALAGPTGVGILSGFDYQNTNGSTFYGHTVDAADTIVKYTYAGDLNLDGVVDDSDAFMFINYYLQDGGGSTIDTPGNYGNGDLNFDGVINDADAFMFINQYPSAELGFPALNVGQYAAAGAASAMAVPEPSTVVLLIMGLGFALVAFVRKRVSR